MDIVELFNIGLVMLAGSVVQGSAGFGFGLFAIPILLFMGLNLPETVIIVATASGIQKIAAVARMGRWMDWRGHAPFMLAGLAALPLGVYCLYVVSFMGRSLIKQVIGALILVLLLVQWKGHIQSRETVPKFWGYLAGIFSGFLNGLANIGGPPMVLWTLAHRWSNRRMRVTLLAFALIFVPFQFLFMGLAFGPRMWPPLQKGLLLVPTVLAGTWLGLKIGDAISRKTLKLYMRLLLLGLALASILGPLF